MKQECMSTATQLDVEDSRKPSVDEALDRLRFQINTVWQNDPSSLDVLKPVFSGICLSSDLINERFASTTATDILAGISLENKTKENQECDQPDDEENILDNEIFKLKQECWGESSSTGLGHIADETVKNESAYWSDIKTVGFGRSENQQYVMYNEAFDPRLTFSGFQHQLFPKSRSVLLPNENDQNVCLAVSDVDDIVDEYVNKYHEYVVSLDKEPGDWINKSKSVLPPKYASLDQWLASNNEVSAEKESDPRYRQLAAKVTSDAVRRLWSEDSSYTFSTSDDQDVFSHQGSVSADSASPHASPSETQNQPNLGQSPQRLPGSPKADVPDDEPISPLWSGRDIDSFKDFVPRYFYETCPSAHCEALEEPETPEASCTCTVEPDTPEIGKSCSRFFNIWCKTSPVQNESEEANTKLPQNLTTKCDDVQPATSPKGGHHIPLLVSTKRRERSCRPIRNMKRTNMADYQVTFTEDNSLPYSGGSSKSSSRATFSDTRVWRTTHNSDEKRGFSKSETHQEYRNGHPLRGQGRLVPVDRIELSAQSEPFYPKFVPSEISEFVCGEKRPCESLHRIAEEMVPIKEMKSPRSEGGHEGGLSPTCEPFIPRRFQSDDLSQEDCLAPSQQHSHFEANSKAQDEDGRNFSNPMTSEMEVGILDNSMEQYAKWSTAQDSSEDVSVKEYGLFESKHPFEDSVFPRTNSYSSKPNSKDCTQPVKMRFTGSGWSPVKEESDLGPNLSRDFDEARTCENTSIWSQNSSRFGPASTPDTWDRMPLSPLERNPSWQSNTAASRYNPSTYKPINDTLKSTPSNSSVYHQYVKQDTSSAQWHTTQTASSRSSSFQTFVQLPNSQQPRQNIPPFGRNPENVDYDECLELTASRVFRHCARPNAERHPSLDVAHSISVPDPVIHPYQRAPFNSSEKQTVAVSSRQSLETPYFMQSHGTSNIHPVRSMSLVSKPVPRIPPPQAYDNNYRKMVVLHPHHTQLEPRPPTMQTAVYPPTYPAQPTLKPTTFPTLRPTIQRIPVDPHPHIQSSVLARPNPAFAPPTRLTSLTAHTYRHVTLAPRPKLVAVPTFDPQPRFFASYLNFNNHNEAYDTDSETVDASFDLIGQQEDNVDQYERTFRARPIRANPANLIQIT